MKKLQGRTWFVLLFILLLLGGTGFLMYSYVTEGGEWVAFKANSHLYSNGQMTTGSLTDRNGLVLYDGETDSYAQDEDIRTACLHAVGDEYGNIVTGGRVLFRGYMAAFHPLTGVGESGNTVALTIDAKINELAYQALDGQRGTVAVYNYETGEILCMVSSPTFDPYDSEEVLIAVNEGDERYDSVYLNRFLSSTFTPGSIFKIVTAAAAIEELDALDSFSFTCTGSMELDDGEITCPSAHGDLDLAGALEHSCNCAFGQLALELGGQRLMRYAQEAGLLSQLTFDGVTSARGSYSVTDKDLDLAWSGVGQYTNLVNPCSMMALMGAIAGEGKAAAPTLLHGVTSPSGLPAAIVGSDSHSIGWSEETCQTLKRLMRGNVTGHYGQQQFGDLPVCAKSGTAEVSSSEQPHAWFVGFVDDPEHPYAFVVMVEHGGWGSKTAGSIAAKVLTAIAETE
ncbi:MAG: penicillin-binding protein [Oscillospiraceae bacterium]|nr:penicillin-binding protein [Oscillospiraceae bacterium]